MALKICITCKIEKNVNEFNPISIRHYKKRKPEYFYKDSYNLYNWGG